MIITFQCLQGRFTVIFTHSADSKWTSQSKPALFSCLSTHALFCHQLVLVASELTLDKLLTAKSKSSSSLSPASSPRGLVCSPYHFLSTNIMYAFETLWKSPRLQIIFFLWKDTCPTKSPFWSDKTAVMLGVMLQTSSIKHCQSKTLVFALEGVKNVRTFCRTTVGI